jgi:hypothetical protein
MVELKQCDRCGKIQRVMIVMQSQWLFKTTNDATVDLCDECVTSAQNWFQSHPNAKHFVYENSQDNSVNKK